MNYRAVQYNTKGEIIIDHDASINGIKVALVNGEKLIGPIYEFNPHQLSALDSIQYEANCVKIHFCDINPATEFEITHSKFIE